MNEKAYYGWRQPTPTTIRSSDIDLLGQLLFLYIVNQTRNEDGFVSFWHGNKSYEIELKRGQSIFAIGRIERELKIGRKRIERSLNALKRYTEMELEAKPFGTIVTMKDWDNITKMELEKQFNSNSIATREQFNSNTSKESVKNDKNVKSETIKDRDNYLTDFLSENLDAIVEKYSNIEEESILKEVSKFIDYWNEKNPKGRKYKWEKQKTFDPILRFYKWIGKALEMGNVEIKKGEAVPLTDDDIKRTFKKVFEREPTESQIKTIQKHSQGGEYTAGFSTFWAFYPTEQRKGKGLAFEEYQKLDNKTKMRALLGVKEYNKKVGGRDGVYIPLPSKWIKEGRWDDESI